MDPRASAPRGTSRTDAGVHARQQLAAFDSVLSVPARGWVLGLNQHLPDDACVRRARPVPVDFDPRSVVRSKRYVYRILRDRVRDPSWHDRGWRVGWPLDLGKMRREAEAIVGTHDYRAFRAALDPRTDTVRTLTRVDVVPDDAGDARLLLVVFEGNAFLYNMVRILVGTLVDVGRGHLSPGTVVRALASGRRGDAGMTAPAAGLTLEAIDLDLPEGGEGAWPP
jgi:tRNA pseudouridine38-40 synthase